MNLDQKFTIHPCDPKCGYLNINKTYVIHIFKADESSAFEKATLIEVIFCEYSQRQADNLGSGADNRINLCNIIKDKDIESNWSDFDFISKSYKIGRSHLKDIITRIEALFTTEQVATETKTIEKPACKECKGSGIIDTGFYTRTCACRL